MNTNDSYVARMEKQLKKWDADLDAFTAAGDRTGDKMSEAYHQCVKDLRANRAAAQQTFKEVRAAGQSAGAKVQARMESAYETMRKNFEKAVASYKS